jgi:uncharacterized protein YutE (UPF0331/DUF86 family)
MNEKINYEIEEIKTYLKDIENLEIKNKIDFLQKRDKQLAASMALFNILNSTIELGEELITSNNLETPLKYREIFQILKENKKLNSNVADKIGKYMHQRNMLAHQYGKINLELIYEVIENKDIFNKFISEILTRNLEN